MAKKTRKFKTEVQQLLDLVIHSLYTKKEIFLRELVSNASDAIDRAKYEGLTDKSILKDSENFKIKISLDKEARTIIIEDNGIGMDFEELEKNIGTIASSGTKKFVASMQESGDSSAELIGQFGVGFYAACMVADKVSLVTKRRGKKQQAYKWESDGTGAYTIDDVEKDSCGTEITLYLSEDQSEFLDDWQIKRIITQYSDYVSHPIVMDATKTEPAEEEGGDPIISIEEETLNSMTAIWKKNKKDVKKDEYKDFYRHISHDHMGEPLRTIHFVAEGVTEFRSLLFLPEKAPFDLYMRDERRGLQRYVKNVFITDDCKELMPDYLRFIKGIVDSSDMPLNVSREMLQDDAVLRRIRKSLVGRILKTLAEMLKKKPEDYDKFWDEFGKVLKEGLHSDFENADKLKDLVLFHSTKTDKPGTLKDYVSRMPEDQTEIYYISGENIDLVKTSPMLEAFNKKGYEVLFFIDPIDEWVAQSLTEYDGKQVKAVDRGDIELDTEKEQKKKEKAREKADTEYKDLIDLMKEELKEDVKDVRFSNRLTDSACCLVADEMGMNANMERIMKSMNQEFQPTLRVLELNSKHPILEKMKGLHKNDKKDQQLKDYCELLFDQALLTEGSPIKNPARFTQLVSDLMVKA